MELDWKPPDETVQSGLEHASSGSSAPRVHRSNAASELANLGPADVISQKRRNRNVSIGGEDASFSRGP